MSLAYTYYITNIITGQYYYGSRCGHIRYNRLPEDDLWIHYFTSSKYVKQLIVQYGINSFNASIIMVNEDYDKCYYFEQQMIADHIGKPLCLNRHCKPKNKFSMAGTVMRQETKDKISAAKLGKPSGAAGTGWSEESKIKASINRKGKPAHNKGKKHSPEAIAKMSESHKGKSHTVTDETRLKLSAARKGKPSSRKGTTLSDDIKAKMSESHKRRNGTDEYNANINKTTTGRVITAEWKANLSAANKGQGKGRKLSDETKAKLSAARRDTLQRRSLYSVPLPPVLS